MKRNKYPEFFILLFGVVITRLIDFAGTYHYTSDLARELNPGVRLFGFGWTYLFAVQIFVVVFSAVINYYSLFKIKRNEVEEKHLSFKEYSSMLYFNKVVKWKWSYVFMKGPDGKYQGMYMYGWLIPRILIYIGIVLTIVHFLLAYVPSYSGIHKYFVVPMYLIMYSSLPICLYQYLRFRYKEYRTANFYI